MDTKVQKIQESVGNEVKVETIKVGKDSNEEETFEGHGYCIVKPRKLIRRIQNME